MRTNEEILEYITSGPNPLSVAYQVVGTYELVYRHERRRLEVLRVFCEVKEPEPYRCMAHKFKDGAWWEDRDFPTSRGSSAEAALEQAVGFLEEQWRLSFRKAE